MIRLIVDTTCCIPGPEIKRLGIPCLPQVIIFGENSYRDDTEMDTATFLSRLVSSPTLPKTAAPPPALYAPIYEQYAAQGDTMIVIAPSAQLSGTYRSAEVAAQDFPNADIRLVDLKTTGGGLGSIVLQAVEWVKMGLDADTLIDRIKDMASHERVYFLVDTLEYLHKGGRIGGAQALLGSILQVKPILTLVDGHIESAETQRTKKKALARLQELVMQDCQRGRITQLSICHCKAEDDAAMLARQLGPALNLTDIPIYNVPPAIVVHAGPGVLEISYFVWPNSN
jgi:DegV family protein with EDD domain